MKRIVKRTFAVLVCMMVLFTVSGCGKDESDTVKDYEDAPKVTLSLVTSQLLSEDLWNDEFTASDGSQVSIVDYSSAYYEKEGLSYRDLLLKRLESNVDIDGYTIHAEDVIEFSRDGYWMDLSSLDAVNSLSADARKQSTFDGKVFSIPLTYTGFGFFWNVEMLEEHGLTVPTNEGEFLNVCEKLKAAGTTPYIANKGFALTVPAMAMGFAELYAADDSKKRISKLADGSTPVSTYMEDGFEFVEMMIDKGYLDPEQAMATTPGEEDLAAFLAGEGAFFCGTLKALEDAGFEVELTGIPTLKDGTVAVVGADYRMAINPNSPNVDYTVELFNNLFTPEWLAKVAAADNSLSSGKGKYDLSYLNKGYRDFAKLVRSGNQIPNQDFSLPFNTWEVIRDLCGEICSGASAGEVTQKYDQIQQEQIAEASE